MDPLEVNFVDGIPFALLDMLTNIHRSGDAVAAEDATSDEVSPSLDEMIINAHAYDERFLEILQSVLIADSLLHAGGEYQAASRSSQVEHPPPAPPLPPPPPPPPPPATYTFDDFMEEMVALSFGGLPLPTSAVSAETDHEAFPVMTASDINWLFSVEVPWTFESAQLEGNLSSWVDADEARCPRCGWSASHT
jgi:hypothetical protein